MLFHVADVPTALREMHRVVKPGGRAILSAPGAESAARLEALHRDAAQRLGYEPAGRVIDRFNMDHVDVVSQEFAKAHRFIRDDAFVFPSSHVTLRYYASGMIDAIADRPPDNSHRARLAALVAEGVEAVITRDGVFRDPKPAGCFVVSVA